MATSVASPLCPPKTGQDPTSCSSTATGGFLTAISYPFLEGFEGLRFVQRVAAVSGLDGGDVDEARAIRLFERGISNY